MSATLTDLPDDVRQLIEPHAAENPATLDAIGLAIAEKREEAKSARVTSGIETVWQECEEAYIGIDDANRHEFTSSRWAKPMAPDGPITTDRRPRQTDYKSTVFVRLTSRYVDAGSAKLAEILLPVDDKAFSFSEMPDPELIKAKDDTSQVVHDGMGNAPLTRPAAPGEPVPAAGPAMSPPVATPAPVAPVVAPVAGAAAPVAGVPGAPAPLSVPGAEQPRVPLTVQDLANEKIELARKKAKAAEKRIYDWMVECQYAAEMRKVIFDAARIGVGVVKAPTPKARRDIVVLNGQSQGSIEIGIREAVKPVAVRIDPWNVFPDPACGENIHHGDYIFERDFMSPRQVRGLKKTPGYIGPQIDKVLEEGPDKIHKSSDDASRATQNKAAEKGRFEVWYFYGSIKREDMDAIDTAAGKSPKQGVLAEQERDEVYAIVTLINDSVVRATINPLDSGSFPYHSVPWQRRTEQWAGIGVAEQMRTPQKVTNAATRALLNNAGKSAGSQFIVDQNGIKPADDNWTITPDKIWYKTVDGPADVRAAFMAVVIPNVGDQMMKIIETGERWAEETTSIPLITQGQSGATTPDTFGAAQLQNNNANQLLRGIGYAFDDYITEPVVRQWYEWLLLDPEVPDDEKGEFTINAQGSAALVERAIQDQTIGQMGSMATNPAFGIDPKKWAKQFLKSKRLDPVDFTYTEEEQAKLDAAPPPEAPAITVAKIAADTAMKQLAAKQGADQQSVASEERIARAAAALEGGHVQNEAERISAEQHRTLAESTVKLHELQMQHDLALLDYANRHQMNLDQVKASLAKTAMQLQTQRQLNAADNAAEGRKKPTASMRPPVQVPGRARNGQAFEQGAPA